MANDIITASYLKKFLRYTDKILIDSLIISTSLSGRLQVLLNFHELASYTPKINNLNENNNSNQNLKI